VLTDDRGCVWRPADDAESGERTPFRSGCVRAPCDRASALLGGLAVARLADALAVL
jgi:hypothetical protein